jgi:serine/threonine-protein phosphatase 2A regulatory subunit B
MTDRARVDNGRLVFPKTQVTSVENEGTEKGKFSNCHTYNVNSLSVCSDREHFLSSDALRINMWNIERPMTAY